MRCMKKGSALLIALTVLCSVLFACPALTASADSVNQPEVGKVGVYYRQISNLGIDPEDLHQRFLNCLSTGTNQLVLSDYQISVSALPTIFDYLRCEVIEGFVLQSAYGYSYQPTEQGDMVVYIKLYYNELYDHYEENLAACEAAADTLLKGVAGNDVLTDAEKALLIHDRLILHGAFNQTALDAGVQADVDYTLYGVLVNRIGMCEGYAKAYRYLLNKVGIPNYYVNSAKWRHAWVIVYIDDKPYHVDITSDDPIYDVLGRVRHKYFLVSDDMLQNGHSDQWGNADDYQDSLPEIPNDTTYDNAYWQNSDAAVQLIGGKLYYMDSQNSALKAVTGDQSLLNVNFRWWTLNTQTGRAGIWNANCTTIADFAGYLLYSQPDGVYRLDLTTGETKLVFQSPLAAAVTTAVYGITCTDGRLNYEIKVTPNDRTPLLAGSIVMGDANNDGVLNVLDLVRAKKLLADQDEAVVPGFGRMENAADMILLRKLTLFGADSLE